jgi:hypothetical protein
MPVNEMIVSISMGLFLVVAFVFLLRLIQAWLLHKTLREAITRDSPLAGGLIDRIGQGDWTAPQQSSDDRTGLVLVALGVAIAGFALVAGEPEWARYVTGAALFPTLVGLALLARHVWLRRAAERDLAAGA